MKPSPGAGLSLDCLRACTLPRRATPYLKACAALRTSRERLLASAGPKSCDRGARTVVGLRAQGPSVVECQQRGRSSAHLHKAPRLLCEPLHDAVAARHVLSLLLPGNGTRVQKVPGLQRGASARSRSRSGAEGSAGCAKEAVEGEMRWNAPARRAPTQERAERTRGGLTWLLDPRTSVEWTPARDLAEGSEVAVERYRGSSRGHREQHDDADRCCGHGPRC